MSFCAGCGKQMNDTERFCSNCGMWNYGAGQVSVNRENIDQAHENAKSGSNWMMVALCIVLCVAVVLSFFIVRNLMPVEFDIDFKEKDIKKFLNKVCDEVDGDARITDASMYDDCIVAEVEVKLKGKKSENVYVRFYRDASGDEVESVQVIMYGYGDADQNQAEAELAVIVALEELLFEHAEADRYLDDYSDVRQLLNKADDDKRFAIDEYVYDDDLRVQIVGEKDKFGTGKVIYIIEED